MIAAIGQGPSVPSMSLEEALRVRPPYKEAPVAAPLCSCIQCIL